MATLEKIRTRAGAFITVIIGIALLSFLVNPQDIINFMQSSKNTVGEINGKKIDIQKFQDEINYYTQVATIDNNGQAPQGEEEYEKVRNQAWDKLIREHLINDEINKIGIGISPKELGDLATGSGLSPVMTSRPRFANPQTGQIYWQDIEMFWQNPNNNPQEQVLINYLENEITSYALISKYIAIINKANYVNKLELKRAVENSSNSAEFNYIIERYMGGAEADSLYKIKESEAKNYYNKHKRRYEQVEARDIEMVAFPIIPSQEDYEFTKTTIEKLSPDFAASINLPEFVQYNSDTRQFDYTYYKQGALPTNVDEFAFSAGKEDVLGPFLDGSSYAIARIEDIKMIPDSVFFKNMLVQANTAEEMLSLADSITNLVQKGGDWAELARMYSADPQVAFNGGEIGWISQDLLGYPLIDSIILNPTGKVISIPTPSGIFIFQASQKSKESKMVRLGTVQKEVIPSKRTDEAAYEKASRLAASGQNGREAFTKAAEENGYMAQPAVNITPASKQVLSIENAQPIVKWLFGDDVEKNSMSPVINVNQKYYVVATVTDAREEGTSPFEQVKYAIGEELKKEKQAEIFAAKMKDATTSSGSIEELASKLNLSVLQVVSPVSFGSVYSYNSYIPGLGLEPKVAAAAATMAELNTLSEPIMGSAGVYVISLTDKRTDEGYTSEMARQSLSQGFMMKQMDMFNVLFKAGGVKDLRAKYF